MSDTAENRLAKVIAQALIESWEVGPAVPEETWELAHQNGLLAVQVLCRNLSVTAEQIEGLGGPPDARQD